MGIQERKERERERRRQQIIVAAKRIFKDKGFGRATMEDMDDMMEEMRQKMKEYKDGQKKDLFDEME